MSFLKDLLRGDPKKAAAKHERRARAHQQRGDELRAAEEWIRTGQNYARIPDFRDAREAFMQAAHLYLAINSIQGEHVALLAAIDVAIAGEEYESAAKAIDQLTRLSTRVRDDETLLFSYSLKALLFIAGNQLTKVKETYRDAEKIHKRLSAKGGKILLFEIAQILIDRFVDGNPAPDDARIPDRVKEPGHIGQMITRLLVLYQQTRESSLLLTLDKEAGKIRQNISGQCMVNSPIPILILKASLSLPSNIALNTPPKFPVDASTEFKTPFVVEAKLPGTFEVGPAQVLVQVEKQRFHIKSNSTTLKIAAAIPRLEIFAEPSTIPYPQEEFELSVRLENNSHGDATNISMKVTLPPALTLKTGILEKKIATLRAQQHVQFPLFLVAVKSGQMEGKIQVQYKTAGERQRRISSDFTLKVKRPKRKEKD